MHVATHKGTGRTNSIHGKKIVYSLYALMDGNSVKSSKDKVIEEKQSCLRKGKTKGISGISFCSRRVQILI